MLNNISWANYLSFVILLLVMYYAVVGVKFYSQEIKDLLSGKTKLRFRSTTSNYSGDEVTNAEGQSLQSELFPSNLNYVPATEEPNDTLQQTKELTHSLRETIAEAVEKSYIREEFILSLQLLLKKYSFLKGTPSLSAINNLIASECEKYGYVQLSAEERVMLWNE
ncbi:hypothetical protein [Paracnuella aquatica]|uniref:hypothetical protein n=1 Tax=Paracnuella aquatica TaxID=2268757 RepID=UPI000F4E9E11|nr:hypothetical protein [Paracnuella aquatica]RPD44044.1 hypothetical protein DRJ53_18320 [Paracnuella aquatica]